jgi:hypothetical protein
MKMAGNTRGKLKEHLEGVHRNMDWAIHHVAKSATLLENQLAQLPAFDTTEGDPDKEIAFFETHPMYKAITALGEGIKTFDDLTQDIYTQV